MDVVVDESKLPRLSGKTVIISGGSSGIGLAAVRILRTLDAQCIVVDRQEPIEPLPSDCDFAKCDITSWADLRAVFDGVAAGGRRIDIAIANAGVTVLEDYTDDILDADGTLKAPDYSLVDVNYIGTLNFVKLAIAAMRRPVAEAVEGATPPGGSIVITTSSCGYMPEQRLPLYSSTKAALNMLIRALRPNLEPYNIAINGVAPTPTMTPMLPPSIMTALNAVNIPISSAHAVALLLVYSATAQQRRRPENYGKETGDVAGRWNGRILIPLGDRCTEVEESLAATKDQWLGRENAAAMRLQQVTTDLRDV